MTGYELWQLRLRRHLKQQIRYLNYVFNDYFLLALVFLLGAALYWYSQWLHHVTVHQVWPLIAIVVIEVIVTQIGQSATLFKTADALFLLPLEMKLKAYLTRSYHYSLLLPTISLVLGQVALWPLVKALGLLPVEGWLIWSFALWFGSLSRLLGQYLKLYQSQNKVNGFVLTPISLMMVVIGFSIGVSVGGIKVSVAALIVALVYWLVLSYRWHHHQYQLLDWLSALELEGRRQTRVLAFYNLFQDVAGLAEQPKRRSYLDRYLNRYATTSNPYYFLYWRYLARSNTYSWAWLRLVLAGCLLVVAFPNWEVQALTMLACQILTAYQLGAFPRHFIGGYYEAVYPLEQDQRRSAFEQISRQWLAVQQVIFFLTAVLAQPALWNTLILLGVAIVIGVLMAQLVLPYQSHHLVK